MAHILRPVNLYWTVSAIFLTILSRVFYSPGPHYEGGIYYILFVFLGTGFYWWKNAKHVLKDFELSLPIFLLGVGILLLGEPLFENDHYRYLWEGKVFLTGHNPYLNAPDSPQLANLSFGPKASIGFSQLSSIYPPLALSWFGLGGVLPFWLGLRVLMLLNAALVFFLFKSLKGKVIPIHLLWLIPIFQKEFIQAVHIDLLAFMFFAVFLLNNGNGLKALLAVFFSFWTKLLGVAAVPFLFFTLPKKFIPLIVLIPISMIGAIKYFFPDPEVLSGAFAFTSSWVWNPGFYSLLTRLIEFDGGTARQITFSAYGIFLLVLSVFIVIRLNRNRFRFTPQELYLYFYLIFGGLMFFTPVYNGWYFIWFAVPALLLRLKTGIFYALSSSLCYISYGFPESLIPMGEFSTHIWFILSFSELVSKKGYFVDEQEAPPKTQNFAQNG